MEKTVMQECYNCQKSFNYLMASCPHCGSKDGGIASGNAILDLITIKTESKELNDIGVSIFQKGNINDGIAHLKKSIELNPFHEQAYSNLGYMHIQKGDYKEAIKILEHVISFSPFRDEAKKYLEQARSLQLKNEKKTEVISVKNNLETKPKWWQFWKNASSNIENKIDIIKNEKIYYEKDNIGTRIDTESRAGSLAEARKVKNVTVPFLNYMFENKDDAMLSIKKLPCIKVAQDSGNIICSEIIEFGVYPVTYKADDGKTFSYSFILAGNSLTYSLWTMAKKYCEEKGGRLFNESAPPQDKTKNNSEKNINTSSIKFIREEKTTEYGFPTVRRFYKAPNKATALEYLKEQTITAQQYFLVIETPEGAVAKDRMGVFEP
jgi:hypothetical protein